MNRKRCHIAAGRVLSNGRAVITFPTIVLLFAVCFLSIALLTSCGAPPPATEEDRITELLEDFYDAAGEFDADELEELTTGQLADMVAQAKDDPLGEKVFRSYKDLEVEVDDVDVDEDDARATVILTRDGSELEQLVKLEREKGEWRVSDFIFKWQLEPYSEMDLVVHTDEAVDREIDYTIISAKDFLEEQSIEVATFRKSMPLDESLPYKRLLDAEQRPPEIIISPRDPGQLEAALEGLKGKVSPPWLLAAEGEESVRMTLPAEAVAQIREMAVRQTVAALKLRLEKLGVLEPEIVVSDEPADERVIKALIHSLEVTYDTRRLLTTPFRLEFRGVVCDAAGEPLKSANREELLDRLGGAPPIGTEILPEYPSGERAAAEAQRAPVAWYDLYGAVVVDGSRINDAKVTQDQYDMPAITINLNAEGGERMRQYTRLNIGKLLAITLDDEVILAATIESEIGSEIMLNLGYRSTRAEAERLAIVLRTGALPVSMHIKSERRVEPAADW